MARVVRNAGVVIGGLPVGGSIVAGELVGFSMGKMVQALGTSGGVVAAVGVSMATYENGDVGAMAQIAEVAGFAGLNPGAALYLSLDTPGDVTAVTPSGSGNLKQQVGVAVTPDRALFVYLEPGATIL